MSNSINVIITPAAQLLFVFYSFTTVRIAYTRKIKLFWLLLDQDSAGKYESQFQKSLKMLLIDDLYVFILLCMLCK